MHAIRKVADGLIGLSASLGALGLLFETVVILIDVVGRAFGHPMYGSQDLISMGMVFCVFGAMALCDRNGGHISVDLAQRYFPDMMNRVIDIIAALIGAVIFVWLAWATYNVVALTILYGMPDSTNMLDLPIMWFRLALCMFSLVTALGMLLRAIELTLTGRDIRLEKQDTLSAESNLQ